MQQNSIKAIIIEDEQSAVDTLTRSLNKYCKQVDIVGNANTVRNGLDLINKTTPDLVFLDVELGNDISFNLLKQLDKIDFRLIFTTAHEKYALKAIKYSAIDYLLKPIDPLELVEAVNKVAQEHYKEFYQKRVEALVNNLDDAFTKHPQLILRDKYGIHQVRTNEIVHLVADGSYTKFIFKDREPLLISKTIKEYDVLLNELDFFRCHKSHLINMSYFSSLNRQEGDMILLKNGDSVPLAIRKKESFMEILEKKSDIK